MKKLTEEEIYRVKEYLNVKEIDYVDFKFELLDHIITQIEEKLNETDQNFEEIYNEVTEQGDSHLQNTSSWIFGVAYSAPKIIMEKAKKIFLKYAIFSFFMIPFLILEWTVQNEAVGYEFVMKGAVVLLLLIAYLQFRKIKKSSKKTVYSFIAKTQMISFLVLPLTVIGVSLKLYATIACFLLSLMLCYSAIIFRKKHDAIVGQFR